MATEKLWARWGAIFRFLCCSFFFLGGVQFVFRPESKDLLVLWESGEVCGGDGL